VGPEDGLGRVGIDVPPFGRQAFADPGRLGGPLALIDLVLAASAVHEDERHEAAAGDQADDQEPPLELGHQGCRVNEDIAGQSRP
jgi:hypothetical protein